MGVKNGPKFNPAEGPESQEIKPPENTAKTTSVLSIPSTSESVRADVKIRQKADAKKLAKLREQVGLQQEAINLERIHEGKGLEEILRAGFEKFHTALVDMSYAEIVRKQLEQISDMKAAEVSRGITTSPGTAVSPEWLHEEVNRRARDRINDLADKLAKDYGQDGGATFVVHGGRGHNKLMISGRRVERDEQGEPKEKLITRVYLSVALDKAPEAFKTLFESLVDEGVVGDIEVAFNNEIYQGESLARSFENNAIVLYVYGRKPELMTRIVKALSRAKRSNQDVWKLETRDLIKAKENMIQDFMIPLDDTSGFVEMNDPQSYHSSVRGKMFVEITGEMPWRGVPTESLAKKLETWTPQRPGLFPDLPHRKKYMPGLVLD